MPQAKTVNLLRYPRFSVKAHLFTAQAFIYIVRYQSRKHLISTRHFISLKSKQKAGTLFYKGVPALTILIFINGGGNVLPNPRPVSWL